MPDARNQGNAPDERALRHSVLPEDDKPERQVCNLGDIMGMPVFKSERSGHGNMPELTAVSIPTHHFTKLHFIIGSAVVKTFSTGGQPGSESWDCSFQYEDFGSF
eukprot:4890646-Pyramimonas_sp.AAC.1